MWERNRFLPAGRHCERQVQIIRTPLSARMVKEPFWLGLITVGTVLLIILMVYCVKRKFADKIEKFLADEIERSKNSKFSSLDPILFLSLTRVICSTAPSMPE